MLGTPESYRSVGDRFDMAKSTLHAVVIDTCTALNVVRSSYIKMPATAVDMQAVADGFVRRTGFPGVIGAVDGTHISIRGPGEHRSSYINRKGNALQSVC